MDAACELDNRQRVLEARHRQCVEDLFNEYADEFDDHLVNGLRYDIPNLLLQQLPPGNFQRCLDLGCGTGLAGLALRSLCARLEGVDLAELMVEKAAERDVYDKVDCRDLIAHMRRQETASYDLLVSTDVIMYLYSADRFFEEAQRVLAPGGTLAFSTEAASDEEAAASGGVVERSSERYAHARSYIMGLTSAGFQLESVKQVPVRLDGDAGPINGDIFVFRRRPAVLNQELEVVDVASPTA